jgi:hypothetical protein
MDKKKRFGDLEVGNVVFVANKKDWTLKPIKIIRIAEASRINLIWIYLESGSNFLVERKESYYEFLLYGVWTNQEEAIKEMMRMAKEQEEVYIKCIDNLISQYDALQNFMIEYGEKV